MASWGPVAMDFWQKASPGFWSLLPGPVPFPALSSLSEGLGQTSV
jgi:hypothetical protein